MSSVLDRPASDAIFPSSGDDNRTVQIRQTGRAFEGEMTDAVQAVLAGGRSPPEIAYAIGEILHNYFRTRGVTLTSYELRRLVAELLARRGASHARPGGGPLVSFTRELAAEDGAETGMQTGEATPVLPDSLFEGPPSRLVTLVPRPVDAALLAEIVVKVRARLGSDPDGVARPIVMGAIDAVLADLLAGEPQESRDRVARRVLSELCGLGPIDRLWADRSIRALYVNGPAWIHVERNGVLEPSAERFRDAAHLREIAGRLVRRRDSDAVMVRLRDGSEGLVVFAPAAPDGPIVALRRGEPGDATFERLIAAGRLDRPMADLLRIATRSRLNIMVAGPAGAGKTALLAALARDLDGARIVTLARDRAFQRPSPLKVELVLSPLTAFATLLAAGTQLRPDLLIIDALQQADVPVLGELLSRGGSGIVAAGGPQLPADASRGMVDLVVRLGPASGGLFVVTSMEDATGARLFVHENGGFRRRPSEPSFAGKVHKVGYGDALASVLR